MATFKHIRFGDGLSVTDDGGNQITVTAGASASTPPDATTSTKGVLQLAGDLAGTAASPQIATGVIVDADVAAANKDGTAATPSLRTLGTGAQQAAAGNDSRFLKAAVAYGTSLPASPVDGQEAVLVDSVTNPSWQWAFRFNAGSSSAYKWEFVGGTPARADVFTAEVTSSTSAVDLATVQAITLPRAGDYDYFISAAGSHGTAGFALAISIPSAPSNSVANAPAPNYSFMLTNASRITGFAASTVVKMQFASLNGGTATFSRRSFSLVPARVS